MTLAIIRFHNKINGNPQGSDQPLFRLSNGPFDRKKVWQLLDATFRRASLSSISYTSHSFRRGAAQDTRGRGLGNKAIQRFSR